MWKSMVVVLAGLFLAMAGMESGMAVADQERPRIGMVQFGMEPNVEVCKQGILKALAEEGYRDGETVDIVYKNAQADFSLVHSCTQDLVRRKVDILVPLSTPCLQSAAQAANRNEDLKIVFGYVYDPYKLGVAKSPEDHLPNVTGISCFVPVEWVLDTIRAVFPDRKEVGIVWNSSEANSEAVIGKLRTYAPTIGLQLVEVTVTGSAEVLEASRALVNRGARVFLSAGDNTLNVAFDSYARVAEENQLPVFSMDSESGDGALIVLGPDYFQTGYDTGKYISRVLKGEKTSDLPICVTKETAFIVNMDVARKLGLSVPEEIVKKASKVVGAESKSN